MAASELLAIIALEIFFVLGLISVGRGIFLHQRFRHWSVTEGTLVRGSLFRASISWTYLGEKYSSSSIGLFSLRKDNTINLFVDPRYLGVVVITDHWTTNGRSWIYFGILTCIITSLLLYIAIFSPWAWMDEIDSLVTIIPRI